jgi:hypothetical protein
MNNLTAINSRNDLNFFGNYNQIYRDAELNDDPYFGIEITCNYNDVSSLASISEGPLFLSINVQSLHSKHEQLVQLLLDFKSLNISVDVLAIQEIWEVRYPELLSLPGFKPLIFKKRRNMRGGGVGFYIREDLNAITIDDLSPFENKIFESLTIQLSYPSSHKSILLTCAYRSNGIHPNLTHSQQMDEFFELFGELVLKLQDTKKESYIFIDANINLLDLANTDSQNYLNLLFAAGYLQGILKATRLQNLSKSLIDHIHFNNPSKKIVSGVLVSDISDHFFTFICVRPDSPKPNIHKDTVSRDFSLANLNNFKRSLGLTDWNNVYNSDNVDTAYDCFWSIYTNLYKQKFPLKRRRFNKNNNAMNKFMTNGLLISRKTKNSLHLLAVADPSPQNLNRYKTFKSVYQRTIRAAKKLHISNKLRENANNPKKTWQTLNEILGKGERTNNVQQINVNGHVSSDNLDMANHFNKFFTNVGEEIANSVPPINKKPEDFINYGRPIPNLQLGNTTAEHVIKTIKKLQPKNSCDIDGVSTKMIKFIGSEIAKPLAYIFNLSLSTGQFPAKLKQCRVIPIFKAGDQLDCDNYRPISLLSSISKILEKIVAEKLIHHLTSNDLLYVHQYGFLPKKSTEHNLMQILNYITTALNDSMFCIGVFLDLRKAFDVCSHSILLEKLKKMGIQDIAHSWFKNYLSGRSQRVDINGVFSDPLNIDISVIQGSILGPILFLCYINDFWLASSLLSVLFADDAACLGKGKNLRELTSFVNQELNKIANWFRANKMAVNTVKTKFIVFRTRGKIVNPADCHLVYNGNEIGQPEDPSMVYDIERIHNNGTTKNFKLLGVLFDEFLSFEDHINSICNKISKSLFCINRIKNFINLETKKTLYYAMIHSHLAYCVNIYSCATETSLKKLMTKQKEAIRMICNAGYRDHTAPLFVRLKILPLSQFIKYSQLKFMHSFAHNMLPFSFRQMWVTNRDRNPDRVLRNADHLYIQPHNYASLKRMPLFNFPRLWNLEGNEKHNPVQHRFLKVVKNNCLVNLT